MDTWLTGGVQRARAEQDVDAALGEHLTVLVADAKRRILLLEASQHRGQAALVVQVIRVSKLKSDAAFRAPRRAVHKHGVGARGGVARLKRQPHSRYLMHPL